MHFLLNMKDSHSFRLSWICFFKLHLKRRGPLFVREFPSMADFDPTDYDGHADDPLAVLEGQEIDELGGKGPQVSWWNFFVGHWASQICFFLGMGLVPDLWINRFRSYHRSSWAKKVYHIMKKSPITLDHRIGCRDKMILTDSPGWRIYSRVILGLWIILKKNMRPSIGSWVYGIYVKRNTFY